MHLRPEEFVDLADGTRADATFPHLAACEACRRQLSDLRTTLASMDASGLDAVPEPPAFFWNQFQQRVNAAVAVEADSGFLARLLSFTRRPAFIPIGAAAAIAIVAAAVTINRDRLISPAPMPSAAIGIAGDTTLAPDSHLEPGDALDDDPSLQLVADLASSIDLAVASDAGLTPRGTAEHALAHLDAQELQELRRLLQAELGT